MSDARKEIEDAQRAERRQLREDAELLTALVAHPGWKRYMALIEAVGQNYHQTAMEPLENVMGAVKQEFAKGALMGLTLAASLPSSKIRESNELTRQPDSQKEE